MSKQFRPWKIDEIQLLPPSVQDFVPKKHLARFILGLVRESLDLREIMSSYPSTLGQPPFDPRMMVALLLHSYASGLYSSRRIAKACRERTDFIMIAALDPPDFRTISDFRKRHLRALAALFLQVLKLCEKAGLVKLGHVALDGTKIKANASKHKAMSYERMKKREAELHAEVDRMLAAAEAADAQDDETHGKTKTGDEMPNWVADKQKRIEKIREAKAALEAEAQAAAEEQRGVETAALAEREAEGRKKPGKPAAPPSDEPAPKAQRNFTDPESRIMKSKDGFVQAYNAQAAVDGTAQVNVAHDLTQSGSDQTQLVPLVAAIAANLGRKPEACGRGLLQRGQSRSVGGARHRRLHRNRTGQAPDRQQRQSRRPVDAGDAKKDRRRRVRDALPVTKADCRTGVRADQTSPRLPSVPVAGRRTSARRMGIALHRPQPPQARPSRVRGLSSRKMPNPRAIWTGS